jgi:hypothetical protein
MSKRNAGPGNPIPKAGAIALTTPGRKRDKSKLPRPKNKAQSPSRFIADIKRIHDEAAGALDAIIIRRRLGLDLFLARGERAERYRSIANKFLAEVPTGRAMCLGCDDELTDALAAIVIVTGSIDAPTTAVVSGACAACARRDDDTLMSITMERLREIWPSMRVADRAAVSRETGTA